MKSAFDLSPAQKENAQHGEKMFPLKRYITKLSDLYPAVTAHWHEEAEVSAIVVTRKRRSRWMYSPTAWLNISALTRLP